MKLVYGSTIVTGELEGFTPGSTEFEIDFGNGCKVLLTAKSDRMATLFDKIRHTMSAIGLAGLKNATVDFNNGSITMGDKNVTPKKSSKPTSIKTAFIA